MLKALILFELIASLILLGLAAWPFSGFCTGRLMTLDCESQAIFAINIYVPLAIVGFFCSIWSLTSNSELPHLILLITVLIVIGRWLTYFYGIFN